MLKKIISAVLCLTMIGCLAACGSKGDDLSDDGGYTQTTSSGETVEEKKVINPLTGLSDISADKVGDRPVAVMINNIKVAWSVQKGLSDADIVYETYAEGGVTRLMAVFKDVSKVKDIGTVRSARYTYVDLASGHDAIYVHCGLDPNYCKPHMKAINMDDFDINTGKTASYGFRVKNGKAREHTMYTSGAKLTQGIEKLGYRTEAKNSNWASFNPENEPAVLSGGACDKLTVPMSDKTYVSTFTYDAATGKYKKTQGGSAHNDTGAGEQIAVTNVLVLFTNVSTYADKYHMNIDLNGGSGYYISNGSYVRINWKKGSTASSPLTFTNTDGTELKLNAGNSWIFFTKKAVESEMRIESATPAVSSAEQTN